MTHKERGRLDWSVRYGARSTYTKRVATDTLEGVADLMARHMPGSAGYEVQRVRLSGPLQGASFRIRRGPFSATVSVQTFSSPGRSAREEDGFELRVVASAQSASTTTALATTPERTGLRLTGGAAASLGVGALALAISGNLTAWATAVLLLPALFATRLCMTLWIADTLSRRQGSAPAALPPATLSAAQVRDDRRWASVLAGLQQLHEDAAQRLMLRPFRGMGTAATALGPAPLRTAG
ncbi:MAG: hypothetical protein ACE37F_06585 [Nannocystaceae bacterium]|nr:hypothetical protein [bacterium]